MLCNIECDAGLARQGVLAEGRISVEIDQQCVRIAELIGAAVRAQMLLRRLREQSQWQEAPASYLSPHAIEKGLKTGRIALKKASPVATTDWQALETSELAHALKVFNDGGFQVLLDGQLHRDPDQVVEITEQSTILFLRLIPLAGG